MPRSAYTPSGIRCKTRRACRACRSESAAVYRGRDDPARRLMSNFKARCRARHLPEAQRWVLNDMRLLLASWAEKNPNVVSPKLHIDFIDRSAPLLPMNAILVLFGMPKDGDVE